MKNPLLPIRAKIIQKIKENSLINTFRLQFETKVQKEFQFAAGQFLMIGLPGFGDAPFTLASNRHDSREYFDVSIRTAGELTEKINELEVGDYLYIRGPFGNGFPEVKRNLIIVGGGCGFIPLRSVLVENMLRTDIKVQAFMGCRNHDSVVFERELESWKSKISMHVILEETEFPNWSTQKGFVTDLIKTTELLKDADVYVCGPEPMYKFVVKVLEEKGILPKDIYLSLERRMHCGVGVCQHCALGSCYVCKDGPVYSVEFLRGLPKEYIDV